MADQVDELGDCVPGPLRDSKQLRYLADRDEDGQAEDEPLHHGARQELRHEAEPQHSGEQEQPAADRSSP